MAPSGIRLDVASTDEQSVVHPEHYAYRVQWSSSDHSYLGTVAEMPSISWLAETPLEAFTGIQTLVLEVIKEMSSSGEPPPVALADRDYFAVGKKAMAGLHVEGDLHHP